MKLNATYRYRLEHKVTIAWFYSLWSCWYWHFYCNSSWIQWEQLINDRGDDGLLVIQMAVQSYRLWAIGVDVLFVAVDLWCTAQLVVSIESIKLSCLIICPFICSRSVAAGAWGKASNDGRLRERAVAVNGTRALVFWVLSRRWFQPSIWKVGGSDVFAYVEEGAQSGRIQILSGWWIPFLVWELWY